MAKHLDDLRPFDQPVISKPFDIAGPRARKRTLERIAPIDPKSWYGQYLNSRHG